MKTRQKLTASLISLSALAQIASGQTYSPLGSNAQMYDLFTLSGASQGDTFMDWDDDGNFNGLMGFGANSEAITGNSMIVGSMSTIQFHTNTEGGDPNDWDATMHPDATLEALGVSNATLNAANTEILTYIGQLNALSSNPSTSYGDYESDVSGSFSQTRTGPVTVIDFDSLTMLEDGNGESFTLNGNASGDDVFIIRIAGDTLFEGSKGKGNNPGTGVPVILNNLDRRNVVWLSADGSLFDLHRNGQQNFEGIIINPTSDDNKDGGTIIGDVDFTGQVFAGSMKLGTGLTFTGASIPEPSAGLLLLFSLSGLTLVRRRR